MSKPLYRSDSEAARAEMVAERIAAGQRVSDDERQRRAHHDALVEAGRVENAKRNAVNRLSRSIRADADYRRALVAVERATTVIDVERAIVDAERGVSASTYNPFIGLDSGESCGALCKCSSKGTCSVSSPSEQGCTRPAYAADSATPFVVWGFNGAAYPGRPESRCHCGQHGGSR